MNTRALPKDIRKLLRPALESGWVLVDRGGPHLRLVAPDQKQAIVMSRTPSDRRSFLNLRARLRRVLCTH